MDLRIARMLHGTTAEGPGRRTAVWVQGCSIRCPGCINPQLFPADRGTMTDVQSIVDGAIVSGDEGITLVGGEPFDQPVACRVLADTAHAGGLGVICFTGFVFDDLRDDPDASALIDAVDLLVDGPYVADDPEVDRALVGSRNQRFIHVTDRYCSYDPAQTKNRLELRIHSDGSTDAAGFLTRPEIRRLANATATRRSTGRRASD